VSSSKAVVRRFFEEFWNAGRLDIAGEVVASDHVHHLPDWDVRWPLGDLEATGRRVEWTGIDIVRVLDGRIVELRGSPGAWVCTSS
jgi:hypothetical protein